MGLLDQLARLLGDEVFAPADYAELFTLLLRTTDMGHIPQSLDSVIVTTAGRMRPHENMDVYAEEETVSCITFNLGYLPGGDHSVATRADSSKRAVESGLTLLKKGGLMTICIYSGGDTGFQERDAMLSFIRQLDPHKYLVIQSEYVNRPNNPPIPVLIIKLQ